MGHDMKDTGAVDERVEVASLSKEHGLAAMETGDYSGASKKTDPAEIALVRKLDLRIMVSVTGLPIAQSSNITADSMGDVLSQLP